MSLEQLLALSVIQGLTEFLPISSSGHLNLLHTLTHWPDQGLLVDIALHTGTLIAVLVYFRQDVWKLVLGGLRLLKGTMTPDGRVALLLAFATLPVASVGYVVLESGLSDRLRSVEIVATANLVFALLLYAADRLGTTGRQMNEMSVSNACVIGIFQLFALFPGASRAGVTISAARFLGYDRTEAARFSMLLSIPVILGSALAGTSQALQTGNAQLGVDLLIAGSFACITALATITFFMRVLQHMTLTPFVIYRLLLGTGLLVWSCL